MTSSYESLVRMVLAARKPCPSTSCEGGKWDAGGALMPCELCQGTATVPAYPTLAAWLSAECPRHIKLRTAIQKHVQTTQRDCERCHGTGRVPVAQPPGTTPEQWDAMVFALVTRGLEDAGFDVLSSTSEDDRCYAEIHDGTVYIGYGDDDAAALLAAVASAVQGATASG